MARTRETVAASSLTAVAIMVLSVLVYLFTLVAAHRLGPEQFGGVSAFLGLLLVANVGALALQATAARRTATCDPEHQDEVVWEVVVSSRQTTIALSVVLVALSPLVAHSLHLSLLSALMAPATIAPLTLAGGYSGILQGTQRWNWLAAALVANGAGRFLAGGLAILLVPTVDGATVGLAIGALVPAFVSWLGCRSFTSPGATRGHGVLAEVWANGQSLLAFFILTNLDVLVARNQFTRFDAGIYAAGSVLAKMCLFLPQFVIVVAFTKMAQDHAADSEDRNWLKPLGAVAAIGALVVGGTALLPELAVVFVGGPEYEALTDHAWLFALEGTIFALLQMVVYRQIARQARVARYLVLGAIGATGVGLSVPMSTNGLVLTMIAATLVAAVPTVLAHSRLESTLQSD
jgi:O-antigen/teichoic acid export membrane protein